MLRIKTDPNNKVSSLDKCSLYVHFILTFSGSSSRMVFLCCASIISYSFLIDANNGRYVLKSSIKYSNTSLCACRHKNFSTDLTC